MAISYTERDWEFLDGEDWYTAFLEAEDTRTPEQMHSDAVTQLKQADVSGDLYDNEVHADLRVTEAGTGVNLYVSHTSGVYLWFGPDADLSVPGDVEACLERAREQSVLDTGGDDPE
jgi:hypothetical protein